MLLQEMVDDINEKKKKKGSKEDLFARVFGVVGWKCSVCLCVISKNPVA